MLGQVDALFDRHNCTAAYLDVGTNTGVQLRKLFEPHKYPGAPVLNIFETVFGGASRCNVCAIGVEPNPRHAERLRTLQARLMAAGAPVLVL